MNLKTSKTAFSLVEIMLFLLVASLITAASIPIVTKKHYKLPQLVSHGAYLCYYKDNKLREARWSGKYVLKKLFDREVTECNFAVPKKAPYFQVSAIGGGGGGGDAGYDGGSPSSGEISDQKFGPFNLTQTDLEQRGISNSEFAKFGGKLSGYALSGSSGAGGTIGYAVATPHTYCTSWKTVADPKVCAESTKEGDYTCYQLDEDGNETGSACYWTTIEETEKTEVCTKVLVESKTCDANESVCTDYEESNCRDVTDYKEDCTYGSTKEVRFKIDCNGTISFSSTPPMADASTGCVTLGQETVEVPNSTPDCKKVENGSHRECDKTCKPNAWVTPQYDCSKYDDVCSESGGGSYTVTKTKFSCTGEENVDYSCGTPPEPTCAKYITPTHKECENEITIYTYSLATQAGNSGASGATCVTPESNYISGALGLSYIGYSNVYDGPNGGDLDTGRSTLDGYFLKDASAFQGYAPCVSTAPVCSGSNPPTSSYVSIGGNKIVEAVSASAGGGGGVRGISASNTDTSSASTINSVAGSCSVGTTGSPCGDGNYGYCLHHYAGYGGNPEHNGQYRWRYTYDNNYLTYGDAGDAGELKTVIVRTLKNVNTKIVIGRGGQAAAERSGNEGQPGNPTMFGLNGSIITASGGKGGKGRLQAPIDTFLPAFEGLGMHEKSYHGVPGTKASPIGLASKIMNMVFDNNDNSDAVNLFMQQGVGGQGGGVNHHCWAGQRVYTFEGQVLTANSVFPSQAAAAAHGGSKYVPAACKTNFNIIKAESGKDGALLIKW